MKRLLTIATVLIVFLAGCERIFTASPLAFLQRDPSTYSEAQQLTYAEDALASGDETAMATAFDLLSGSTDPETQLLAVELALGAAGVQTALTSVIAGMTAEGADPEAVIADALAGFSEADLGMLVEAASLLDSADGSTTPSAEQYAFVAIGLVAAAAEDAGGVENLNPPPVDSDAEGYVDQATAFLTAAETILVADGGDAELLEAFTGLLP